jgi:hypothetical protein
MRTRHEKKEITRGNRERKRWTRNGRIKAREDDKIINKARMELNR